ncbi:MAG TPA: 23S rRNA (pseudouridine(1915)-N(3))-methyltransferase RlmH [Candidatus Methylomirabilis sp.]|nr:23S rRNA (pseudouridine(1915)-N(3))-methyltransferase RlmH [Candidatus Methylomirabilis sp.]
MKKTIIRTIGRPTEPWQREAIHMYQERLSPFGGVDVVELPDGHGGTAKPDVARAMKTEAASLLQGIPPDAYVVALDERGKALSSLQFAKLAAEWTSEGTTVVFLIGGSWGLDSSVTKRAHLVLSLGFMTFPHILARIVLLEQIYRTGMIRSGKTYHK